MKRIIRLMFIVVFLGLLAYFGACVYGNFFANQSGIDAPSDNDAQYSLVIKNSATVILTNDYEVFGEEVGSRTYRLHGYWELIGTEFEYRDSNIVLSEQTFGEIILKRRK